MTVCAIWVTYGWQTALGLIVFIVVWTSFSYALTFWSERREDRHRREDPCVHGVAGARYNLKLCQACESEVEQKAQEIRLAKEAEKHRKEAEERKRYQSWIAEIRLPEYLKSIDPEEFENLICELFSRIGYRVETTSYAGDNGSDGYLYKGSEKTVLQCKRVKGSVGEPVLRDLFGTMHATKCTNAIVVTTGTISKQARAWVAGKPIRIIELDELRTMMDLHFKETDVVPADFTFTASDLCPQCGKKLRIINGRRGRFLGCTGYPNCKYTRSNKA